MVQHLMVRSIGDGINVRRVVVSFPALVRPHNGVRIDGQPLVRIDSD
jgi:hypothetical protein